VDFVKTKSAPKAVVTDTKYPAVGKFHALNIVTALLYESKAKSGLNSSLKVKRLNKARFPHTKWKPGFF